MYARFHKNPLWKLVVGFYAGNFEVKNNSRENSFQVHSLIAFFFPWKISQSTSSRHISDAITKEEGFLHMLKEQEAVKNAREEIVSQRTYRVKDTPIIITTPIYKRYKVFFFKISRIYRLHPQVSSPVATRLSFLGLQR